jgi:hypothetical protein
MKKKRKVWCFMRIGKWIGGAVLTLGLSFGIPSIAKADHLRDDHGRDNGRFVHETRGREIRQDVVVEHRPIIRDRVIVQQPVYVTTDIDQTVQLCDVPSCVASTLSREGYNGRVEAVQFVRRGGENFYRFRVDNSRGCFDLRISADGGFLGIGTAL